MRRGLPTQGISEFMHICATLSRPFQLQRHFYAPSYGNFAWRTTWVSYLHRTTPGLSYRTGHRAWPASCRFGALERATSSQLPGKPAVGTPAGQAPTLLNTSHAGKPSGKPPALFQPP